MRKLYLFFFVDVLICNYCPSIASSVEIGAVTNMKQLQQAVIKLAGVASNIDSDDESIWAFDKADSIAQSISLEEDAIWKDLGKAYTALSYVAYGMSYTNCVMCGSPELLNALCNYIIRCDPDTVKPNKCLHTMELYSDRSFLFFYFVSSNDSIGLQKSVDALNSEMEIQDSIYSKEELLNKVDDKGISESFRQFQMVNRSFYFVYFTILNAFFSSPKYTYEEYKQKHDAVMEIAYELDALPREWTELDGMKIVMKQIGLRAKLIDMLAEEIALLSKE